MPDIRRLLQHMLGVAAAGLGLADRALANGATTAAPAAASQSSLFEQLGRGTILRLILLAALVIVVAFVTLRLVAWARR